jgi:type VI secretion system FHA domain protein
MKLMLSIALCPAGCNMEGQTHQFDITGGSFGRAPDNTWVLPDPSRYVSSRHGSIGFENDQFLLTDESTNGIYMNGDSLPLGSAQPSVLKNGDLLVFGDYRIQINIEETTNVISSEPTTEVDVLPNNAESVSASPVFVDDLDKWLEPSSPQSGVVAPAKGSINISSSPLVQSAKAIDLGLKEEEKDPLALLGFVNKSEGSAGMPANSASGPLTDLLGEASPIDQRMMKVPSVIPDDWDDLLGGSSSDSLASQPAEPVQLTPSVVENKVLEPKPRDADQTTYIEAAPAVEKSRPKAPVADAPKEFASRAPETLGLSELLSTPQEMLQTESSPQSSEVYSSEQKATSEPKEIPEPVNVERQSLSTGGGTDLARALGLERLSADQQNMLNETVANTVKETVAGMMRTLRARSEIKSEFRMNMTTIQSAENNPLKFSVTPDDAIENMFAKEGKAYLSPVDAMNDGFADISDHQVALFDAMKAAYENILGQFDPSVLTRKFEKTTSKRFLGGGKGKNWDAYQSLFEEYKEDNELTFKRLFGEVFADAYERRMHSLKMSRNSLSGGSSGNK